MADIILNSEKKEEKKGGFLAPLLGLGALALGAFLWWKNTNAKKTTPADVGGTPPFDYTTTDPEIPTPDDTTTETPNPNNTGGSPAVDNTQSKVNSIFDVVNNPNSSNADVTTAIQSAVLPAVAILAGGHGGVASSDLYAVNDYGMQSSIGGYTKDTLNQIMLSDGTVKTQAWYKAIKEAGLTEAQAEALSDKRVAEGSAQSTISEAQKLKNIADNANSKTSSSSGGGSATNTQKETVTQKTTSSGSGSSSSKSSTPVNNYVSPLKFSDSVNFGASNTSNVGGSATNTQKNIVSQRYDFSSPKAFADSVNVRGSKSNFVDSED